MGIARPNGPNYAAVVELLTSLCEVKAFILLAFIDLDATEALFDFLLRFVPVCLCMWWVCSVLVSCIRHTYSADHSYWLSCVG